MELLALAAILTAASLAPAGAARTDIALALALTVPGVVFVSCSLDMEAVGSPVTAFALAVVVTVALYALVSLALVGVGLPLSRLAFLVVADGVVLALCLSNVVSRRSVSPPSQVVARNLRSLTIPVASVAVSAGVAFAFAGLPGPSASPYEAIYATGPAAAGQSVPTDGGRARVGLAIVNGSQRPGAYRIDAVLGNGARWRSLEINVRPRATWYGNVSGPATSASCRRVQPQTRIAVELKDRGNGRSLTQLVVWLRATRCRHLSSSRRRRGGHARR